jgi:hypothetical protein
MSEQSFHTGARAKKEKEGRRGRRRRRKLNARFLKKKRMTNASERC